MNFDNEISECKVQLYEGLGKVLSVMERAYGSFAESSQDTNAATANYYHLCGEIITESEGVANITSKISASIQKADIECLPEAVCALGALLDIYVSFREVLEEYLSECESVIKIKDTPFPARTLVRQTDILIRKISMLRKDIQRI